MDPITMTAIPEAASLTTGLSGLLGALTSGTLTLILLLVLLPRLSAFILTLASKWQIFEKAGCSGWKVLIPFYSRFCFYDITWENGWFSLASYIPGLAAVFHIITMVKLSCCFEKNSVFALGLVFFEPLFLAILGFDDSEFV